MHYAPGSEKCPLPYAPFKACTVPRPIGWLSTLSTEGVANLAPYSQWQNLSFDPPMVMFSANRNEDGSQKDTVVNALATNWFVWNMATWDLREAVNVSAMEVGGEVDEFDLAGVTKAACIDTDVPRVAESPAHYECQVIGHHVLDGTTPQGTCDVIFAKVTRIHVDERFVTQDGRLDIPKIKPIARMGYYDYAVVEDVFEMKIPNAAGTSLASGLEGRGS